MPDTPFKSNFAFLAEHDPRLAEIGREAEQLASISPTACMMQVRMLAELLAKETAAYLGIYVDESTSFYDLLRRLEREDAFRDNIDDLFHEVRMNANDVVHGDVYLGDSQGVAKQYLRLVRRIAIWFHRSFGRDPDFSAGPFIDPPDLASQREEILGQNRHLQEAVEDAEKALAEANARASLAQERYAEAEQLLERLREERNVFREFAIEYETRLAELRARADAAGPAERSARAERMRRAGEQVELDDRETRALIDAQLRIQGWGADHEVLHWQHGARPEPGRALAIADVPTAAGLADYVLFDGLTPLAIIEAERWDSPVEEGLEEAKLHSRAWDLADYVPPTGSPWVIDGLDYEVPFVFASNGREYIARSDAGGGVLFRDLRHPMGDVRALDRWFEPEALRQLVAATTTTH